MNDPDDDLRQQIALFRYSVIADLVHLPVGAPGAGAMMRAKAEQTYSIPGTTRTRVAAETMRHWINDYLRAVSLGAAGGGRPLRPRSHPRRRPLRRSRCRAACARHGGSRPGCADRAECRPRQCSRRPSNAGLRHRRWRDPGRPAAGTVARSHRGRAGRAGRRAESERRRLKRAPRHPDRTAAGAGGRGASLVATTVAARRLCARARAGAGSRRAGSRVCPAAPAARGYRRHRAVC